MPPNTFIMEIYHITNLIILILYHKCYCFLYKFSQSSNCLTPRKTRITLFSGRSEYLPLLLSRRQPQERWILIRQAVLLFNLWSSPAWARTFLFMQIYTSAYLRM